jgi:hypothetical protein
VIRTVLVVALIAWWMFVAIVTIMSCGKRREPITGAQSFRVAVIFVVQMFVLLYIAGPHR